KRKSKVNIRKSFTGSTPKEAIEFHSVLLARLRGRLRAMSSGLAAKRDPYGLSGSATTHSKMTTNSLRLCSADHGIAATPARRKFTKPLAQYKPRMPRPSTNVPWALTHRTNRDRKSVV